LQVISGRKVDFAVSVLGKNLVILFARERRPAESKQVENDSHAKQVTDGLILSLEVFQIHHFRSHVTRSSTTHEKVRVILAVLSQTEICNNAIIVIFLSKENILRLEVSVHNSMTMHDLQALEDTLHDHLDLTTCEFMAGFNLVIKLSTL
jgi:hypothetical protein